MKIENISFIEESSISFVVSPYWEIEESDLLFELILGKKSDLKEKIIGADRLSYRFIYKNKDYFFHVEAYSQSCWIESPTGDMSEMIDLWQSF